MLGFGRIAGLCASVGFLAFSSVLAANPLYTLNLRGEVPTVCRAEIKDATLGETGEMTARLHEFCNSGAGYSVYAVASNPELRVSVDGQLVSAQADGRLLLSRASQPTIATREISLAGAAGGTIRITVVAS